MTYDKNGRVLAYHGGPIHLTNTTAQEPKLQAQIKEWRKPFEAFASEVLGESKVTLDQTTCQKQECLLGDFMADAMLDYRVSAGQKVDFALINAGGVRATIDIGPITRGEVLTSFPFGNSLIQLSLTGDYIWKVLEGIVSGASQINQKPVTSFLQVSKGIKVEYNPANANGTRLVRVAIGGQPLDRAKNYTVVTLDFLAGGGDNFLTPTNNFVTLDTQDQILTNYIKAKTPVDIKLDGRIAVVNGSAGSATGSGGNGTSGGNRTSGATSAILSASSTTGFAVFGTFFALFAVFFAL